MIQKQKDIGLLTDNPKEERADDEFGFGLYVDFLGESINPIDDLPFTVGIFGEWGTGKTTLMKFLEKWFVEKEIKTLWLNPWKYDKKEELWAALIRTILIEIGGRDQSLKKQVGKLLREMSFVAIKSGISYISGGLITGSIERFRENLAEAKKSEHEFLHNFDNEFKKLIEKYVGKKEKLIIFIDDLDRCKPENAITVLEALKLYLDNKQCVFILGIDRIIIEKGIKAIYGDKVDISGREYLDKIIQLPFYIPPIQYEKLNKSLKSKLTRYYSKNIWALINYGFGGNPRKAKRFVNSYYLVKKALKSRTLGEQYSDRISDDELNKFNNYPEKDRYFFLAKILIIQMIYPDFYDFLVYDSQGLELYEKFIDTEGIIVVDKEPRNKRQELEPYLKNRDLKKFMENTHCGTNIFPKQPPHYVIKYLLLLTGFVEGTKSKPSTKSEGTASQPLPSGTAQYDSSSNISGTTIISDGSSSPTVK